MACAATPESWKRSCRGSTSAIAIADAAPDKTPVAGSRVIAIAQVANGRRGYRSQVSARLGRAIACNPLRKRAPSVSPRSFHRSFGVRACIRVATQLPRGSPRGPVYADIWDGPRCTRGSAARNGRSSDRGMNSVGCAPGRFQTGSAAGFPARTRSSRSSHGFAPSRLKTSLASVSRGSASSPRPSETSHSACSSRVAAR